MFVPYLLNTLYKMFVIPQGCLNNVFVFSRCIRLYFLYKESLKTDGSLLVDSLIAHIL